MSDTDPTPLPAPEVTPPVTAARGAGRVTAPRAAKPKAPPKPRAPRARKTPALPAALVAELEAYRARRDELLATIEAAEGRIEAVRRKIREAAELGDFWRSLAGVRDEILATRGRIADTRREAADTADALLSLRRVAAAARAEAVAARKSAADTEATLRIVREQAAEVESARPAPDGLTGTAAPLRDELSRLISEARSTLAELKAAHDGAKKPAPPVETAGAALAPQAADGPAAEPLPDVSPVPVADQAEGVRGRLVRHLSEAWAVEKEQIGLLQALADGTDDPGLRAELDRHRALSRRQQEAVAARVRQLGGEPGGGRGLLGGIITRVWDALRAPQDGPDEAIEALMKAVSAAEFEAGLYLAVHALALATGDGETAALAASHLREERESADRLRAMIPPIAAAAARRAPAAV